MTLPPNDLPPQTFAAYEELTPEQQAAFSAHYNSRKRDTVLMVLLAIVFPIQLFLLRKIGLGILFWLTAGGFGVWYVIEWFLTPGRVRDYNYRVASDALNLIKSGKTLSTAPTPVEAEGELEEE